MSHTSDGSLVNKDILFRELLPKSTRKQLVNQQKKHQAIVKEMLKKNYYDGEKTIQHSQSRTNIQHPQQENGTTCTIPQTLAEFFENIFQHYENKPCVGYRSLKRMISKQVKVGEVMKTWYTPEFEQTATIYTYKEYAERVDALARSIQKCFHLESSGGDDDLTSFEHSDEEKHDRFAIFDETSYEWFITAQALFKQNVTVVTVYASLGIESLMTALNESKSSGIMVNFASLKDIVPKIASECPNVKYILYNCRMCENTPEAITKREETLKELAKYNLVLATIDELIEMGLKEKQTPFQVKGQPHTTSDIAIMMYTSGTTSAPKGVLITHHSLLSSISSYNTCVGVEFMNEFVHVAFLPLAHIIEILVESIILLRGGMIGYGSARFLSEGSAMPSGDLQFWRPTVLVGVPKVFDTIKKGAELQLSSIYEKKGRFMGWLVNTLFEIAYSSKKAALQQRRDTPLWNWLVFKKFINGVGGRLNLILSGGSGIVPETHEFLRICLNCSVSQGYGLTETNGGTAVMNALTPFSTGTCGAPVPCVEIRLRDVPDMGYTHNDLPYPRGELLVRGENITVGYFKQQQLTLDAYGKLPRDDKNCFFETGDIAEILPNGSIRIIDRKKNLIKLMHGEYIALNKLESIYGNSPFVQPSGVLVVGDSSRDYPVALILPQMKYVEQVARELGINGTQLELIRNPQIVKQVQNSFDKLANDAKLANFERVKKVYLCEEEWTIENGLLTATQKHKRPAIAERYKSAITQMYQ